MTADVLPSQASLRILCLEDNPLIVLHLEHMIEDLGHVFAAACESFSELKDRFSGLDVDCVLVDIDLADGRTGPEAAAWLFARNVPAVFVTGQEQIAEAFRDLVVEVVPKPVAPESLQRALAKATTG